MTANPIEQSSASVAKAAPDPRDYKAVPTDPHDDRRSHTPVTGVGRTAIRSQFEIKESELLVGQQKVAEELQVRIGIWICFGSRLDRLGPV